MLQTAFAMQPLLTVADLEAAVLRMPLGFELQHFRKFRAFGLRLSPCSTLTCLVPLMETLVAPLLFIVFIGSLGFWGLGFCAAGLQVPWLKGYLNSKMSKNRSGPCNKGPIRSGFEIRAPRSLQRLNPKPQHAFKATSSKAEAPYILT